MEFRTVEIALAASALLVLVAWIGWMRSGERRRQMENAAWHREEARQAMERHRTLPPGWHPETRKLLTDAEAAVFAAMLDEALKGTHYDRRPR